MFDIGFSELALIFVIGLLVLGPTRLPIAIRTVMGWVGAIRSMASNVQNELKQELQLQELQESIKKAEKLSLQQLSPELGKTVEDLKISTEKLRSDLKQKARATNTTLEQQIREMESAVKSQCTTSEHKSPSDTQEILDEIIVDPHYQADLATGSEEEVAELEEENDAMAHIQQYYPEDYDEPVLAPDLNPPPKNKANS